MGDIGQPLRKIEVLPIEKPLLPATPTPKRRHQTRDGSGLDVVEVGLAGVAGAAGEHAGGVGQDRCSTTGAASTTSPTSTGASGSAPGTRSSASRHWPST